MNCYLCGRQGVSLFRKTKNRRLLFCSRCNLIYVSKLDYSNGSPPLESGKKFLKEYVKERNLFTNYFEKKLEEIEKLVKHGSVLDIGAGAGIFLAVAKRKGWSVLGVEPSGGAAGYAVSQGLEIKKTTIERAKLNSKKFDVVTLFQTIEHMEDPLAVLKKARGLLKNGGVLFITTPNRQSFLGRLSGKRWFGYYNYEHFFFFDEKSLKFLLKRAGFDKVKIEVESGRVLTPSWVLTRLTDYYYDHRNLIRKVFTAFRPFWAYFDWVKFREPGVNLVVIARVNKKK